ncbi:MAG TPA: thiamine phosphate synthase [Chthoniobacterales bacterium]|nr:thiamine phosphate synthase [Chthoniobacterales bacterium]
MLPPDSLGRARLYAILDLGYVAPEDAEKVTERLIEGGADIIQLRAKEQSVGALREIARQVHCLTSSAKVPLIINDHPEIARDVQLEGLHLGQGDLPIAAAREIVRREDCWIGKSTHSVAQAIAAQAEGADYIGFGPLFATPTKPDYQPIGLGEIVRVHELVQLPIFCIGGIKLENLPDVLAAGARRVVIVSGLLQSADVVAASRSAKQLITQK